MSDDFYSHTTLCKSMKNSDGHSPDSEAIPFDSIYCQIPTRFDSIRFGTTNQYICVANN